MNIFDIDPIAIADAGAFLHLENPVNGDLLYVTDDKGKEDKSKPIGLVLQGADSKAFKRAVALSVAKNQKKRGIDVSKLDESEIVKLLGEGEANGIDLILAVTKEARNIVVNGEAVKTKAQIKALYATQPWVREQADAFFNDRANYLGNAPKP